ncbi:MAG: hypothetical protein ACLQU2_05780 [Candidatus Binataceae bacterium]
MEISRVQAGSLDHLEDWTIVAINQREIGAKHPFMVGEMPFNDSEGMADRPSSVSIAAIRP